jgi:diacylglycerol kinase (ATP)
MRNKFLGTGESGYHPLRKLRIVLAGLRYAVFYDFSVAYKLVVSALVLTAAFVLRQWVDALLVIVATGMVLTAELLNSAIEAVCDYLKTERDERIKVIKDVAAAAAGVSIAVWLVVLVFEFSRLWPLIASRWL